MTETALNIPQFLVPVTMTFPSLYIPMSDEPKQLPTKSYQLDRSNFEHNIWEDQYLPKKFYDSYYDEVTIIKKFSLTLLQDSEDIPKEFIEVINEDFWDIL
jgi:hypothetical protein